jgi:hypothetical protein
MSDNNQADQLDLTLRIAKAICSGAYVRAKDGAVLKSDPIKLHEHIVVSEDGKVVTLVDFVRGESGSWYSLDLPVEQVAACLEGRLAPEDWMCLSTLPNTVPVIVSPPRASMAGPVHQ